MSLPKGCANDLNSLFAQITIWRGLQGKNMETRHLQKRRYNPQFMRNLFNCCWLHDNNPIQNRSGARARDVRYHRSRKAYAPYPVRAGRDR